MKQSKFSETNSVPSRRLRIDPDDGDTSPADQLTCRQDESGSGRAVPAGGQIVTAQTS